MDEPTNHLDILSREVVEESLDGFEGTLLVVSHDRYFLDRECDEIWELEDAKIEVFDGNYSAYREEKRKREREAAAASAQAPLRAQEKAKERPKDSQPSQAQLGRDADKEAARKVKELARRQQELEASIATLEERKKELEDSFLDPELTKRPDKMRLLSEELGKVKDQLEAAFDKWQELETRK
jgi:ATP-binding cassette subfamily F protein 3